MSIPQTTFRYCCLYFDNLTGIYSWLFIDVLSLLPPEWSITVCKVNVQCPLTLLRILWQSYRYIDISWLFIDVLSFLPPIPEWSITFYKVNVQFPPQPHLELTITVYLDRYYVMFQTPLPTHPPLNGTSPFELYRLLIIKPILPPPPPSLLEWCIPSNFNCTVSLSAVTVSTTGMVTESQDTDGMRPAQAAAVIQIFVLYSCVF